MSPIEIGDGVGVTLAGRLREALAAVLDPCSVFNGTRMSFVELGMSDAFESRGPGHLVFRLLLDDPVCLYVGEIHRQIRDAALEVSGVERVDIEFAENSIWTEERATAATRRRIAERRELLRGEIRRRQLARDR
jgi:metal-sulfur cluster biosynthetic enzyme